MFSRHRAEEVCRQLRLFLLSKKQVRLLLKLEGPRIVRRLTRRTSLLDLATQVGLSNVYLSQIKNRHSTLSPEAYLRLAEVELER